METNKYLKEVLKQEALEDDGPELKELRSEREKIEKIILEKFSESSPSIRYGGSKAKGTMIKSSFDLDITVYFDHNDTKCGSSLKEIFDNVTEAFSETYLPVPKNASIRLESKGDNNMYTHIDIVPGRFISDNKENEDVFIHQNTGEKGFLKTNLNKHKEFISKSGLREEIKLAKIWKIKNNLEVKTFVLELLLIKILKEYVGKPLEDNMILFWETLRDKINNITIIDPANSSNDLTDILNKSKYTLCSSASTALYYVNSDSWKSIFGEVNNLEKVNIEDSTPMAITSTPKPWSSIS